MGKGAFMSMYAYRVTISFHWAQSIIIFENWLEYSKIMNIKKKLLKIIK